MVKVEAKICRFCGHDFLRPAESTAGQKTVWHRVLPIIGGVAGLLMLVGMCTSQAPTSPEQTLAEVTGGMGANSSDGSDHRPEALGVTIKMLQAAYDANEAKAQRDYGDKLLAVSGNVESVTLDFANDPTVKLSDKGREINAYFDQNEAGEAVAQLKKGQRVTVACYKVSEVLGTPNLSDCYVNKEVWDITETADSK